MKTIIITICLIGSVFANPILHNVLVSDEQDSNSTESLSVSQSSENTSELQSSEEVVSTQSTQSESSESSESASENKTSEESDSQSDEVIEIDPMLETKDNSMGSEENVRKVQTWVKMFSNVGHVSSAEDNTSTEVEGHSQDVSKQLTHILMTAGSRANLPLLDKSMDSSSDSTDLAAANSNSTESNSSESQESEETSDSSDANKSSKESDESEESDSAESEQVKAKDCVNGTQSCESEENFPQSIGDDAYFSVDSLMMPDEENMELRLRR